MSSTWGLSWGVAWANSWGQIAPEQVVSSGMRRLMMYQLQEDSLKADQEQKIFKVAAQEAAEKLTQVAPKKKVKLEPLVPLETFPKVEFKRKVIHTKPVAILKGIPEVLQQMDYQNWYQSSIQMWQQFTVVKQVEAENDADYRIRLLLLAA